MKISLKPYSGKIFYRNRIFDINSNHNVFYGLKDMLHKFGVEINTIDMAPSNVDLFVYCDVPYPWEIKIWFNLLLHRNKNILFVFESPLINPINQLRFIKFLFKKIYTWNDEMVDYVKYFKFFIPQTDLKVRTKSKPKGMASFMITNNKKTNALRFFGRSMGGCDDLYKDRLKVVDKILRTKGCMLFGKGWEGRFDKTQNFGGAVSESEKFATIGKYRYYFAVENCTAPGYITEKIFDAFRSGVVPIYLGAENINKFIPKECFINYREFKSLDEMFNYLKHLSEKKYLNYKKQIKRFMNSSNTSSKWSKESFEKLISSLT